jgi:hypothetical protein
VPHFVLPPPPPGFTALPDVQPQRPNNVPPVVAFFVYAGVFCNFNNPNTLCVEANTFGIAEVTAECTGKGPKTCPGLTRRTAQDPASQASGTDTQPIKTPKQPPTDAKHPTTVPATTAAQP